jgi:hypothetical protein
MSKRFPASWSTSRSFEVTSLLRNVTNHPNNIMAPYTLNLIPSNQRYETSSVQRINYYIYIRKWNRDFWVMD